MANLLTVYYANAASSTIATANKLYANASGTSGTNQTYSLLGTATGFGQCWPQGNTAAWAALGSIGSPDGHGFCLDSAQLSLNGQDIIAGSWTAAIRFGAAIGTGGTLGGSFTADIYVRVYKYNTSTSTYTNIITMSLAGQTINSTLTTYSLSGSTASATSFGTNDVLYTDAWLNVTANTSGSTENVRFNRLSTDTTTLKGDTAAQIVTPGYQATSSSTNFDTFITEQLTSFSAEAGVLLTGYYATITEKLTTFSAEASFLTNYYTTITEQLTSFTAEASAVASTPVLNTPLMVSISGTPVAVLESGFEIDDSISSVSTAQFVVRDDTGSAHYTRSQRVVISDYLSGLGVLFTGYIASSDEDRVTPNALILSSIAARDDVYLAQKRSYPGPEFSSEYAGVIFTEMMNQLAAEGITASYYSHRETTAAQLTTGTLSNVVGNTSVGDGVLELARAGSTYNDTLFDVTMPATAALKFQATCAVANGGHLYHYRKIWSGSYTLASGDTLGYSMWISSTSPKAQMGVDLIFSDGSTLRAAATPGTDNQGLAPSPATDRTGLAVDTWYDTGSGLSSSLTGKTIVGVTLGVEGAEVGTYTAYFRNIRINKAAGGTQTFFNGTLLQNPSVQVQNAGYNNASVTVVNTYDNVYSITGTESSLSASIVQSSIINWVEYAPAGTSATMETSIDNNATLQACTNHGSIPSLLAGMNTSGVAVRLKRTLRITGPSPEISPSITGGTVQIVPSYSGTKTDVTYLEDTQANFNVGTLTNVIATSGGSLTLNGLYRTYDTADQSSQTNYGNSGNFFGILNRQLYMQTTGGGEERCRLDWLGTWTNGTFEANVQISANGSIALEYRTTNWQSNSNTFAYRISVATGGVSLDRATNNASGTGTKTNISFVSVTLADGDWHRLKLVVSGSNHRLYLDDVLYINATDSTWSSGGQCAVCFTNMTAGFARVFVDAVGYAASLTGNRVSAAQSLASAGTYADSRTWWDASNLDTTSVLIESTINGGSTWLACTNGGTIPGLTAGQSLTGVSVQFRETLTASNATLQPSLNALSVVVIGQLAASGTRTGPTLSLSSVNRLSNSLVGWNANLPVGTTLGVDARIDSGSWTDVTASPGGTIPGLAVQAAPFIETFDGTSAYSYLSYSRSGGSTATWTLDTTNSRISAVGGSGAFYDAVFDDDIDMFADMDRSDAGGLAWRATDTSNFYALTIRDASSSSSANTATFYKYTAGVASTLGTASIAFTRGTYKRVRVTMIGAVITVYLDGTSILTYTDASPIASGRCGLWNDGGTARFYQLYLIRLGQDASSHTVQTRFRLSTTNPLASPQVLDHVVAAYGESIGKGALIPQTAYKRKYIADNADDLAKQSNYWWNIRNKQASFLPMTGVPAPWIVTGSDVLDADLKVSNQSELYRNRQIITNVIDTTPVSWTRIADGTTTSWTFGLAWAAAPVITVNGVAKSVGVKNVDSGRDFYYAVGEDSIYQDGSQTAYQSGIVLQFSGTGQFETESIADDTAGQATLAALEISSGIVENVEDGGGISKNAGNALAQSRLTQYGVLGRKLSFTTRKGLAPGQLITVFIPEHALSDSLFLIRNIRTTATPNGDGTHTYWFNVDAVSGPDTGSWLKLYERS